MYKNTLTRSKKILRGACSGNTLTLFESRITDEVHILTLKKLYKLIEFVN